MREKRIILKGKGLALRPLLDQLFDQVDDRADELDENGSKYDFFNRGLVAVFLFLPHCFDLLYVVYCSQLVDYSYIIIHIFIDFNRFSINLLIL